jgi:ParB/RepB/Spo0J family partition protein
MKTTPVAPALAPGQIGVKNIPTKDLVPNPHNPRLLFDKQPLDTLQESIRKVGILVPLTVYWGEKEKRWVILDGQRRWMCAQRLNKEKVPVNEVAEPTIVQNIVTMFQIHRLREDWELMPTALKLDVLMRELKEKSDKKLAILTGLDPAVVSRCKKLLSYPKKYQDLMLVPEPSKRVRADFFIELYSVRNDRTVNKMRWFSKDKFTRRMLDKYLKRNAGLKAVTDFRIMKQHISNAVRAGKAQVITKKLKEFTDNDRLTLDHLLIKSADVSASARKLLRSVTKLDETIKAIDVEDYYGEEQLWRSLTKLINTIQSKLTAAGRRLKQ